jgi:hypothetical protein
MSELSHRDERTGERCARSRPFRVRLHRRAAMPVSDRAPFYQGAKFCGSIPPGLFSPSNQVRRKRISKTLQLPELGFDFGQ